MENKKYGMADLLAEFGDQFDNYRELHFVPDDETVSQEEQVEQVEEVKEEKQEQEKKPAEPKDITLKCKKCENDFLWTVKDQEFYKSKGFFRPSYCKDCRKKMKVVNNFHKDM